MLQRKISNENHATFPSKNAYGTFLMVSRSYLESQLSREYNYILVYIPTCHSGVFYHFLCDNFTMATIANPTDENLVNLTTVAYLHALEAKCAIQKEKIPAGQKIITR